MGERKPLDGKATGLMLLLCAVWSLQQILIKAAAPDMAPTLQIAVRSGCSAILVVLFMLFTKEKISFKGSPWLAGLFAGALFALEFFLVGEGLRYTNASHMVVLLYTAPAFVAIGLHILIPEERLFPIQWIGLLIAFAGIVIAFSGKGENATASAPNILLGDILGLMAGAAWGATTIVVRCTRLATIPASQTLLYQLISGFVILLAGAIVTDQHHVTMTAIVWTSLLYQSIIVSFASFLAWFWLLRTYLASRLGVLSFMTPMLGVVLGIVILNEKTETNFLIGAVLVLFGIILVSGHSWMKSLLVRRSK
ncbi:DMT family transporter [Microvirga sp. W0021]|uniref:DMT family transporter n=1 Tax=Hohaiivirga grylli TaxID=3133970 RepID=A0ABV0BJ39_9HYPH